MGQKTTKIADIYAGNGIDMHIIVDHTATKNKIKLYKKWYECNNDDSSGWHKQKVNEFNSYADALQFVTNYIAGLIGL